MEEDLEQFLRSRGIPQADIIRMTRDKVDKAVISIMTDEQMAKYISSYGDRVSVLSFCKQTMSSPDKETLIQRIRDKIETRKMSSRRKGLQNPGEGMSRQRNLSAEKSSRKIEIGWLHFDKNEYHQVRTNNGGGTRHVSVEKTSTVAQILELGKELFFPNGPSTKGHTDDFTFEVCDVKRKQIPLDDTVGRLYEQTKLKLLRFYICTKEEGPSPDQSSTEEDYCEASSVSIPEGAGSQLTKDGSHLDVHDSITDPLDHGHSSDSDISQQNLHFQLQQRPKRKAMSETVTAQGPRTSQPFRSTPKDIETIHTGQWQDTNANNHDLEVHWNNLQPSNDFNDSTDIVDLTGAAPNVSLQTEPEHIRQVNFDEEPVADDADTVLWDPEDNSRADGDETVVITLHYINSEDITQSTEMNGLPLPSSNDLPTLALESIDGEAVQTAQHSGPTLLPQDPSSQPSLSTSPDNPGNPENTRRMSIRRIKVVEDLLSVFMDSSIMYLTLKMYFVNENAIDDAGVSREVYTAFWEQFLEQCEGETERVPRLRPDFCEAEWQAVGRIWVKGLLDHGVMPVKLSKAFILACIHGIDSVDVDVLMMSFFNFLPPVERSAVEKALQGTMEESDEEDLLDLFTRMGSHFLPPKNRMQTAIETMAHKAILQEPKYIIDCFSTPMEFCSINCQTKEVYCLCMRQRRPQAKVSQLLETTNMVLSQREQATFNHLQRYIKNADQTKAEKILRFCTGSSVMCVDKIMVCFNAETGLNRRPVAHTCGATLEVPCTYSSYPEFRTEFDNILSSNYFQMDIL
ncbi:uncharacterized protein LOC132884236 [Neoarius graeffei]|uniref:uncharacterized protein LOC132884236 n=1 Tax=Neoarius graeffei TaxID=443677 RepID=UPI00298C67A4|nr:uncharacterized protein LOC132884236 [Neoarius graeffei]